MTKSMLVIDWLKKIRWILKEILITCQYIHHDNNSRRKSLLLLLLLYANYYLKKYWNSSNMMLTNMMMRWSTTTTILYPFNFDRQNRSLRTVDDNTYGIIFHLSLLYAILSKQFYLSYQLSSNTYKKTSLSWQKWIKWKSSWNKLSKSMSFTLTQED